MLFVKRRILKVGFVPIQKVAPWVDPRRATTWRERERKKTSSWRQIFGDWTLSEIRNNVIKPESECSLIASSFPVHYCSWSETIHFNSAFILTWNIRWPFQAAFLWSWKTSDRRGRVETIPRQEKKNVPIEVGFIRFLEHLWGFQLLFANELSIT